MTRFLTIISFSLLASFTIQAQTTLSYTDIYGNKFCVSNYEKLSSIFDTTFFTSNFKGQFNKCETFPDTTRFLMTIVQIKKSGRSTYDLKILKSPLTTNPIEILKNSGYLNYKLKVKYKNGKAVSKGIKYIDLDI